MTDLRMTFNDTVRLVFATFAVAFVPYGLSRRIRSHTGEKLDRWQEGVVILFGLRLAALVMFAACMAWMIDPRSMSWSEVPIPVWLRWVGVVAVGLAVALLVWTFHALGRNITDTVVTRREHSLVTSGPYRWVRHPFYSAWAVAMAGCSLAMANWFIFSAAVVVFGFVVARTRIEEAKLIERFGDQYREFMRNVGRFLPRLWT